MSQCLLACALGCTGAIGGAVGEGPTGGGVTRDTQPPATVVGSEGCGQVEVGQSTLRRLNEREYLNTVRDLFGTDDLPALVLPSDQKNGEGFDTDGDSMTLGPEAASLYFDAAEVVATHVLGAGQAPFRACANLSEAEARACVEAELPVWLGRAFRRPPSATLLGQFSQFLALEPTYAGMAQATLILTLVSPHFLFHLKTPSDAGVVTDGYELANRLAYFLWSSPPDGELLELAGSGTLAEDGVLRAQITRLLDDARSARMVEDFASLWIGVDSLPGRAANAEEEALFTDMVNETHLFSSMVLGSDLPLRALVESQEGHVNGRLAAHYGVEGVAADADFALRTLPAERKGLLTQGAILAYKSPSGFSDPIRRGSWVAERIVCQAPTAAPPEGVGALEMPGDGETVRDVLEQHRSDPVCAGCHALMDPYGLALEHFDAVGHYREAYDNGTPVDPSGELVTGEVFGNLDELSEILAHNGRVETCLAELVTTYGVGRSLTHAEACLVEELVHGLMDANPDGVTFEDVVVAIVTSPVFVGSAGE